VSFKLLNQFISLSRLNKNFILILADSFALIFVIFSSFSLRLGEWFWPSNELILVVLGAPIIAIPIFIRFGMYNTIIRYIGFYSLWEVFQAVSLYALIWGIICFLSALDGIPRSVILINWFLAIIAIGGLRIFGRWIIFDVINNNLNKRTQVLIYGAGAAGRQLAVALFQSFEFHPVAFIDDDKELWKQSIHGLKVSSPDELEFLIRKFNTNEILLAMPSLDVQSRKKIINFLEPLPIHVRSLPSLDGLAKGKIKIADLHEVSIKDILGRSHVPANNNLLDLNIKSKVVMVTGAGGSIGSELCRQIIKLNPECLILYEISEFALYKVEQELAKLNFNNIRVVPMLGSVQNMRRLKYIFNHFNVQTIYHSAAYKHVPLVEYNSNEGIENNVFGTLKCSIAATLEGVETFVLISTDKAVRPTNIMGASKRLAEMILQSLSKNSGQFVKEFEEILNYEVDKDILQTQFSIVRFGNVLNSSGSVVPLFKRQIKDGGPVTVTDPNVIRYFMTITEAVELVIQAGAMGLGGEVFVLDMGEPVLIEDLAKKMIRLSGKEIRDSSNPDGDIEINYVGLRPGEKLFEELLIGDNVSSTDNPMIMKAIEETLTLDELKIIIDDLKIAIQNNDSEKLREIIKTAVSGFRTDNKITDNFYLN
jgi:FlaA1/EpsC-like NDP-sugar epimerase